MVGRYHTAADGWIVWSRAKICDYATASLVAALDNRGDVRRRLCSINSEHSIANSSRSYGSDGRRHLMKDRAGESKASSETNASKDALYPKRVAHSESSMHQMVPAGSESHDPRCESAEEYFLSKKGSRQGSDGEEHMHQADHSSTVSMQASLTSDTSIGKVPEDRAWLAESIWSRHRYYPVGEQALQEIQKQSKPQAVKRPHIETAARLIAPLSSPSRQAQPEGVHWASLRCRLQKSAP